MGCRIGSIRSIGWSCQAQALTCFILTVLLNRHWQQVPNTYVLGAKRRWLGVNCVERIGIWPVLRTLNWQWLGNLLSTRIFWSSKANGFIPWFLPNTVWTPWWVVERRASKKYTAYIASSNKKLNEASQNQTRRMRQQTSPDSLLLNLWSALPNSRLPL